MTLTAASTERESGRVATRSLYHSGANPCFQMPSHSGSQHLSGSLGTNHYNLMYKGQGPPHSCAKPKGCNCLLWKVTSYCLLAWPDSIVNLRFYLNWKMNVAMQVRIWKHKFYINSSATKIFILCFNLTDIPIGYRVFDFQGQPCIHP